MGESSKMTLSSDMDLDSPRSEDSSDEETKPMTNEEYLMTLKRLQQHQLRVRSHDVEREASFTKYLPMSERLTLTKESKVLTLWQQRQKEWQNV
jgi:beta-xylosidase